MASRSAQRRANRKGRGGKHRVERQAPEVVTWLGAGAITLGMGAALASGTGVASADSGESSSGSSSSSSSDSGTSNSGSDGSSPSSSTSSSETSDRTAPKTSEKKSSDVRQADAEVDEPLKRRQSAEEERTLKASPGSDEPSESDDLDDKSAKSEPQIESSEGSVVAVTVVEQQAQTPEEEPSNEEPVIAAALALPVAAVRETAAVSHSAMAITAELVEEETPPPSIFDMIPPGFTEAEWATYIQRFKDVDPQGLYLTPATPGAGAYYISGVYSSDVYRMTMEQGMSILGTAGFSLTSAGVLKYTNATGGEVAIMWNPHPEFGVESLVIPLGIVRLGAGQSVILSDPQAQYVQVQKRYGQPVAIAALGYGSFESSTPDPEPQPEVPLLGSPIIESPTIGQRVEAALSRIQTVLTRALGTAARAIVQVVEGVLRFLGFSAPSLDQSVSPITAKALYERLLDKAQNAPNSIWIDKVTSATGSKFVVYLGGTLPYSLSLTQATVLANVPAYAGVPKAAQIASITKALVEGAGIDAEVMLVGFSQGGMDAQNIARLGLFNVSTVVTYGSPILYDAPTGYRTVHLEAEDDPVPALSRWTFPVIDRKSEIKSNNDAGNIFLRKPSTHFQYQSQFWNPMRGMDMHGARATYVDIGNKFDRDSGYRNVKQNILRFKGTVVSSWGN